MTTSTFVLRDPISASERELLRFAVEKAGARIDDFVRCKAVEAAEMALLENRRIVIPVADWEAFEA